MKPLTLISLAIIAVGLYVEYTKDSSFQSIDMGSLLIAGGAGALIGNML